MPSPTPFPEPAVAYRPDRDGRRGRAAAALAALAGVQLDGWQRMVLDAGCDRRGGNWSAFEVGVICPRQNGKTVLLAVRELAGALCFGERLVIHSAHEWRTVSEQFTATLDLVEGSPLNRYKRRVRKTGGEESISFSNGSRIRFMNRSRESARGFSADCVILDEAHALTLEQAGAMLPTLSARPDAQVWYAAAGPAPGAWQLARLRNRALSAEPGRLAWLEWSADPDRDNLEDPQVWARCNPAEASGRLSLERMAEERATLGASGFAAERLAAAPWPSAEAGAWQVFSEADYAAMTAGGEAGGMMAVGLEMSTDIELAAVVLAEAGVNDTVKVDMAFYGPADGAAAAAARLCTGQGAGLGGCGVFCDPMPCAGLLDPLRAAGVRVHLLEAVDVAAAAYEFKASVRGRRVTAAGHEALREAMRFAVRRPLASGFAFERRRVEVDMSPLNAAAFGLWGLLHGQAPFFGAWR